MRLVVYLGEIALRSWQSLGKQPSCNINCLSCQLRVFSKLLNHQASKSEVLTNAPCGELKVSRHFPFERMHMNNTCSKSIFKLHTSASSLQLIVSSWESHVESLNLLPVDLSSEHPDLGFQINKSQSISVPKASAWNLFINYRLWMRDERDEREPVCDPMNRIGIRVSNMLTPIECYTVMLFIEKFSKLVGFKVIGRNGRNKSFRARSL